MTDQDRGAYAPQADAPLTFETFDARSRGGGGGGRRPMPMTLIGSVVVLAVLGSAAFMFYRSGSHDQAPPPVGAALGPIKSAPDAATQPHDPGAGLDVYSPQNVPTAAPKAPAFAAAPEQPLPRPAPKPVQVAQAAPAPGAPKPGLRVEAVKPAPARLALPAKTVTTTTTKIETAAVPPAKAAKVATVTTKTVVAEPAAKAPALAKVPKPTLLAAAKPAPVAEADDAADAPPAPTLKASLPASSVGGAASVQIGAFSSAALADRGYGDVSAKMAGQMGGRSKSVEPLARAGKTLYRTTVRGFADRDAAAAFCAALKAKGAACIVKS